MKILLFLIIGIMTSFDLFADDLFCTQEAIIVDIDGKTYADESSKQASDGPIRFDIENLEITRGIKQNKIFTRKIVKQSDNVYKENFIMNATFVFNEQRSKVVFTESYRDRTTVILYSCE